jgi:hypothetical protein
MLIHPQVMQRERERRWEMGEGRVERGEGRGERGEGRGERGGEAESGKRNNIPKTTEPGSCRF